MPQFKIQTPRFPFVISNTGGNISPKDVRFVRNPHSGKMLRYGPSSATARKVEGALNLGKGSSRRGKTNNTLEVNRFGEVDGFSSSHLLVLYLRRKYC